MNNKCRKVIISFIIFSVITVLLPAEAEKAEAKPCQSPVKVETKEVKTDSQAFVSDLKIPVISGMANKKIQSGINKIFEEDAINFRNKLEKDAKEALEEYKKHGIGVFHKYEAYTAYQVRYNKNCLLSITVMYYQYTGGAHGMEVQRGYNFDLKTGKQLQLSDLFEDGFNYKQAIDKEVLDYMNAHKDKFFSESITSFKGISTNQPYYLEEGNLIVYFGEYEIAPYSSGIPEFKIPYSELKLRNDFNRRLS